eukprot:1309606-Amphidinium_carterae.1
MLCPGWALLSQATKAPHGQESSLLNLLAGKLLASVEQGKHIYPKYDDADTCFGCLQGQVFKKGSVLVWGLSSGPPLNEALKALLRLRALR